MRVSIVFCHFRTGMMSAYTIAQLLKYKGRHEIEIIVVDNCADDSSKEYFAPFVNEIIYVPYPLDRIQSHGVGIEYALENGFVSNEYFITIESDSFPTKEGWLDYYFNLIDNGYEMAGSHLKLSGGSYIHPCGAFYSQSLWEEAKKYCDSIEYRYFPNLAMRDGFANHVMIHKRILQQVMENPDDYLELASEYQNNTMQVMKEKDAYYRPVVAPFHNGMGMREESVKTYGFRTIESEAPMVILDNKMPIIKRVGYEPGQWLTAYAYGTGKKVFQIPTETKWIPGKENQQQEYTKMENGFTHLWGISAYHDFEGGDAEITQIKRSTPEELYNSLPNHQKI